MTFLPGGGTRQSLSFLSCVWFVHLSTAPLVMLRVPKTTSHCVWWLVFNCLKPSGFGVSVLFLFCLFPRDIWHTTMSACLLFLWVKMGTGSSEAWKLCAEFLRPQQRWASDGDVGWALEARRRGNCVQSSSGHGKVSQWWWCGVVCRIVLLGL